MRARAAPLYLGESQGNAVTLRSKDADPYVGAMALNPRHTYSPFHAAASIPFFRHFAWFFSPRRRRPVRSRGEPGSDDVRAESAPPGR